MHGDKIQSLRNGKVQESYEELRALAFDREDCREKCMAFNLELHRIHDMLVDGEIRKKKARELAGALVTSVCASGPDESSRVLYSYSCPANAPTPVTVAEEAEPAAV